MIDDDGEWISSDDCTITKPYACKLDSTWNLTVHVEYTCEEGWKQRESVCYFVGEEKETLVFANATSDCVAMGAQLVSIHSDDER